jgi:hypothetical protein
MRSVTRRMRSDKNFSQTSLFSFFIVYFGFHILFVHGIPESSQESMGFVEEVLTF